MPRLIDADALLEYLDKRRTYEVMDGRNKAYGKGVRDAMKDLEDAPTIPAIPVEWLNEMKHWAAIDGDSECVNVIAYLLDRWQKEQEAR